MILKIAEIVFFGVFAINFFFPFSGAGLIEAVVSAVIAIVLIA